MNLLAKVSEILGGRKGAEMLPPSVSITDGWSLFGTRNIARIRYTDTDLSAAYAAHEIVYACINKIADVMNDAEIIVEKKNAEGEWEAVPGHRLVALFKRPNSIETGRDFRRLMVQSEQSTGIFYAELVRSRGGQLVEMHPLNPNKVEVRADSNNRRITAYRVTRGDGTYYDIDPDNMLIRRRVDLTSRFSGYAPLRAALKSVNGDLGLSDYVDAFFESDATPSGILKVAGRIDDARKAATQDKWMQNYGRGGSRQKKIAVLDDSAEFQRIGSNLNELAADSLSDRFESRICAVFGVPPNLVGANVGLRHVTANATAKAELRNFWDNKISPELAVLREWLTWYVLPEYEEIETIAAEKIRVGFDISQAAFLQEEVNDIHARARDNFKAGLIKLNEARDMLGMPPDEDAGEDYYVQPINVIAVSGAERQREAVSADEATEAATGSGNGQNEPILDIPQDDEPKQLGAGYYDLALELLSEQSKLPARNGKLNFGDPVKKKYQLGDLTLSREPNEIEAALDLKGMAEDLETEKERAMRALLRFRDELITQAVAKIERLTPETVYTLTLTPDPKTRKALSKTLMDAYRRGLAQVQKELAGQKGSGVTLETKDEFEDESFLEELVDLIVSKLINEVQVRAVNLYVTLRTLLDYSVDRLRDMLAEQSTKFVEQVAASGANAAIQTGRYAGFAMHEDDIREFQYSAILDQNVCGPCADADGMTSNDADELPSAPNPDCEGMDRCRCFIVAVAKAEAE